MMHRHTCSQNTHICKMNWEKNVIIEVKYAEPHLEENFKLSFIIALFPFLLQLWTSENQGDEGDAGEGEN